MSRAGLSRRQALAGMAAAGGIAVAPGVMLYGVAWGRALDEAVSDKTRWGLLIDAGLCPEDCTACVSACAEENGLDGAGRPATDAQWIRKLTVRDPATNRTIAFPVMCQHCADPPCVEVCPTGASFKRDDGIVLVDKHTCIGCRYCMLACPYKARSFVHEAISGQKTYAPRGKGTVESCTFCVHRVDSDRMPACVEACRATGNAAMTFGDLNDPDSEISQALARYPTSQIRADLGLDLGVRYQGI